MRTFRENNKAADFLVNLGCDSRGKDVFDDPSHIPP